MIDVYRFSLEALRQWFAGLTDAHLELVAEEIGNQIAGIMPEIDAGDRATRSRLLAVRKLIANEQDRRLTLKRLSNAGPRLVIPMRSNEIKNEVKQ